MKQVMGNKKQAIILPLVLAGCMALGLVIGRSMLSPGAGYSSNSSYGEMEYQKIQDVIRILDSKYVDNVDGDSLFESAIGDMLHKLDPHSNYIPAKDLALANEQIQGQFAGVGVRFLILRDTICVTNVIENSPAEKAGVKAGDKIIKVDKTITARKKVTNEDVMALLKGPSGTKVTVTVVRNGNKLSKTLTRGAIPINSILSAYMIDGKTGFIKIDQFSLNTTKEFRDASAKLLANGMTKMVLDLRNNGGGVLRSATEIADEFLRANKVIVSTKGEHSREMKYMSTSVGVLEDIKLVVLINENSASASEILAGALQDNDRATIVGRRSFGKGLVQEDVQLRDGSNLRLTIARYYTPTGRCIQKAYNGNMDEYMHEQVNRYDNGELYRPDSTLFVDSLKFKTPKGKIVYGGGGIMPDVFVPLDTTGSSWYLAELRYSMAFQSFAFDFVRNKRSQWKSASQFAKTFVVSDDVLNSFTSYSAKTYSIPFVAREFNSSKTLMKQVMKSEIARQLWTEDGYYQVINQTDKEVLRALKLF